jgi:dTDP-4-amino-4,6-dideoxygalactose transaminase
MIKFLDLKAINDSFEPELSRAIQRVFDLGCLLHGNNVKNVETKLSTYVGVKFTCSKLYNSAGK